MITLKKSRTIDRAKNEVTGFTAMFELLEQKVLLGGLSQATLMNYGRCLARISLHYGCLLYTSPSPRDKRQSRMPSSA